MQKQDNSVTQNLRNAVSQLKSEIDSAFSKKILKDNSSYADDSFIVEEDKTLKLTEYLLQVKEQQLNKLHSEQEHTNASIITLANIFLATITTRPNLEWMMQEVAKIIRADKAVMWIQKENDYSVVTANISSQGGEKIFMSLLSTLAEHDDNNAEFTKGGRHYLAYTSMINETQSTVALLFIRDLNVKPFTSKEKELASVLSEVIFTVTVETL